ncbi:MAG TPA: CRISPR-associated RAMP protein Csx7 [Thermodesulfobacteriota bacterium]|nr:CRISPR-associated RAMP protein Csx7 [Thermodesulfobacteriota bacterium]
MILENRYEIKGEIELITGLHIGSGQTSDRTEDPIIRDQLGRPLVPGSSFKGALRSTVEKLVSPLPRIKSCCLIQGNGCLSVNRGLQESYKQESDKIEFLQSHLCDTCKLFGSPFLASKIRIPDLSVKEPWFEELFEIRDGVGIDRDTETVAPEVKFDYEVVSSRAVFNFHIIGENLFPKDKFLLCVGLKEMVNGKAPLGGITSRGLGFFKLKLKDVFFFELRDLKNPGEINIDKLLKYIQGQSDEEKMERIDPEEFLRSSIVGFLEIIKRKKEGEEDVKRNL